METRNVVVRATGRDMVILLEVAISLGFSAGGDCDEHRDRCVVGPPEWG